jgi:RNA polymerase sigma factor (sigma-70 family)
MSSELSFRELLDRVRAGDRQAASELATRYEEQIRRRIRLYLGDGDRLRALVDSADIFQSVFSKFFAQLLKGNFDLREPGQLLALLGRMARNRVADKARGAEGKWPGAPPEALKQVADGDDPGNLLAVRDLLGRVWECFNDEERRLAEERADGRTWEEMGAARGVSADAVRKQLDRASKRARELLRLDG